MALSKPQLVEVDDSDFKLVRDDKSSNAECEVFRTSFGEFTNFEDNAISEIDKCAFKWLRKYEEESCTKWNKVNFESNPKRWVDIQQVH